MTPRGYFAAGGALLVSAVVVAIVLVATLGAGGRAHTASSPAASSSLVPHSFSNPAIGLSGVAPADWVYVRGPRFVDLRSRDPSAVIFIYAPGKALTASQLVATELAAIRAKYADVRIARGSAFGLGGLPAESRVVSAVNSHRVAVRILVIGARGRHTNYIFDAVTAYSGPPRDLAETREIVQGLRLTG